MLDSPSYYPKNHGLDLTDWFVKHGRSVADLTDLLASAVTVEKPKSQERSAGVERFFVGRKFAPALLARAIMDDVDIVSDPESGLVYRWEGRFWEPYDLGYIRQKALRMLEDDASSSKADDVARMIRDLSTLPVGREFNDNKDLICLQNGMFNLVTGDILPHDKAYFATHMLPIEFDPANVPDCPSWKKRLQEWNPAPLVVRELQKFFGYCLTRQTRYERMLLLYGPGGDGKSTVMKILRALVGELNCSHIPMGRLEDQFYLSRLVDKLVNMSTEVEARAMQSMEIKAIVSGDPICASFKNQTPFDFEPFCKLVYSTNRLPKMLDNSDGFFRKIMIIEFKGQFVKRGSANIFLYDELLQELPGIFAWALAGLVMLLDEGFSQVAEMQQSLTDYKRINNNVLYYIEQHVQADPAGRAGKTSVYEDYGKRCRAWNLMPIGEPHFRREFNKLIDELGIEVRDGKLSSSDESGRRPNAYVGIRLVEEKDIEGTDSASSPPPPSAGGAS